MAKEVLLVCVVWAIVALVGVTAGGSPSAWSSKGGPSSGYGQGQAWKWKPKRWYVQCPENTWDTERMGEDEGCRSGRYLQPGDADWPQSNDADHWCCVEEDRNVGGPQPCALGSDGQPIDPNCQGFTRPTSGRTSSTGSSRSSDGQGGDGNNGASWNAHHLLEKKTQGHHLLKKSQGPAWGGSGKWSQGQGWKWKPKRWYVQCPDNTWDTGRLGGDPGCTSGRYLQPNDAEWPDSSDADHWCCVEQNKNVGGAQPCALNSDGQPIDPNCTGFTRPTSGGTSSNGSWVEEGGNGNGGHGSADGSSYGQGSQSGGSQSYGSQGGSGSPSYGEGSQPGSQSYGEGSQVGSQSESYDQGSGSGSTYSNGYGN